MYQIKSLLGAKIKSLRNEKGITQEYFAEKIGISPRSVSFIENGKNYPAPETLAAICQLHIGREKCTMPSNVVSCGYRSKWAA